MPEPGTTLTVVVKEGVKKARVDKIVSDEVPDLSRKRVQDLFAMGNVLMSGKSLKKNARVNGGDVIEVTFAELPEVKVEPIEMDLSVIFEDEHLLVVNKATGLITHPAEGIYEPTLVHGVLHHTGGKLSRLGGEERPGVVHRLDRETSGVIIFAKTDKAYLALIEMFSARLLTKKYLALVKGVPRLLSGTIKLPIMRHPISRHKMCVHENGKHAHTDWKLEENIGDQYALLRCHIHTGRTHQIRVHLSDMRNPILGDSNYGYRASHEKVDAPPHILLHSVQTQLKHPITGEELDLRAPIPKTFADYVLYLKSVICVE